MSYLEQLFAKMRRNKLVISTRKSVVVTNWVVRQNRCVLLMLSMRSMRKCGLPTRMPTAVHRTTNPCLTEQLWEELSEEIERFLTTISLADLIKNEEIMMISQEHDRRQIGANFPQ